MKIDIIKKSEQVTTKWTGGTTTELAIFPKGSRFKDRNFACRLSVAKVEIDESSFTSLPGIARTLMVLEGKLTLQHPGQYTTTLEKFGTDSFEGDWDTISYGRATDFNLMTTGKTKATLAGYTIKKDEIHHENIPADISVMGCYIYRGSIVIMTSDQHAANEGDLLLIYPENGVDKLKISASEDAEIVLVNIRNL